MKFISDNFYWILHRYLIFLYGQKATVDPFSTIILNDKRENLGVEAV